MMFSDMHKCTAVPTVVFPGSHQRSLHAAPPSSSLDRISYFCPMPCPF